MKVALTFLFLVSSLSSFCQTTCDSLLAYKNKFYGFKPSNLSDSQKDSKSKDLDIFWSTARRNPSEAAICLRDLIINENKDSYFCFDASSLLLRLDTTDRYLPTVVQGLNKCNLDDLQLSHYLNICFYLGVKGQDIGTLSNKLISIPNAEIFLANHFITLNAIDASLFLYNTLPTSIAEKALIEIIKNGNNTARHNGSIVLNLLSTDRGDSIINLLIANKEIGDSTIKFINKDRKSFVVKCKGNVSRTKIIENLNDVPYNFEREFYGFAGNDKLICSAINQLNQGDIELLRKTRSKTTPGLSDEALHEYFAITKILMSIRAKKTKE